MAADGTVELRGESPREVVDVLDAISQSRRLTRFQLVNEILSEWARQRLHEHMVMQRVIRSNPVEPENVGKVSGRSRDSAFGGLS